MQIQKQKLKSIQNFIEKNTMLGIIFILSAIATASFVIFFKNGLGLAYNDARSHLDIGRRVVEGLKPGIAQVGSVWLPLPHLLMIPTVWNNFMWHTGLAGALQSMSSFVATGVLIYLYLKHLKVRWFGRIIGVFVFVANLNILYLQSTAMTELLLLATMTAGCYYLLLWQTQGKIVNILKSAFFIMLSTMVRYDGWFLFLFAALIIFVSSIRKKGIKKAEGMEILYLTLAGFGIVLWFVWNAAIFKDPLYFAFGPFSAHAQQEQLQNAGILFTKGNLLFSLKIYLYSLLYNSYASIAFLGAFGALVFWFDKKIKSEIKIVTLSLVAPLIFNILALYMGHSVLFIQGVSGNTWFNVRYGIMLAPSIAIFTGYLVNKLKDLRWVFLGIILVTVFFAFVNFDAVSIDDARVGSSQKNVSEVSSWLDKNAKDKPGYILISVASHDAILFSSGLPMSKFIHEGTGAYWTNAIKFPDRWARWIVMRTHDKNDLTWKEIEGNSALEKYNLVQTLPFADIYELKDDYLTNLTVKPVLGRQK